MSDLKQEDTSCWSIFLVACMSFLVAALDGCVVDVLCVHFYEYLLVLHSFQKYTAPKHIFLLLELRRPPARPPGAGRMESGGCGWAWDRILRRKCPGAARARALAQRPGPHFLVNIWSQACQSPSTSSLQAPGGRTSGRLSSKEGKKDV